VTRLQQFLVLFVRSFGGVAPSLAGRALSFLWFRVTKFRPHTKREHWISQSLRYEVPHRGKAFNIYVRKPGTPAKGQVLLLHGWSGRWDQLLNIGDALLSEGFEVLSFDLPAHGENPGTDSDVFEFSELLTSVYATLQLKAPILICHSMAFLTFSHAHGQKKLPFSKLVTISSPSSFEYLIEQFREAVGFSKKLDAELWKAVERRVRVPDAKTQLKASHMSSIPSERVLIIHDKNDQQVKCSETGSLKKIWPEASLFLTSGQGHNRILSNQDVIARIAAFCQEGSLTNL